MSRLFRAFQLSAILTGAALLVLPVPAEALPDLGLAGSYAVYGSKMIDMTVSSGNTDVFGDLAVGPNAEIDFSGGGTIHGNLDHDAGTTVNISGGSQVLGSINSTVDTQAIDDDARDARDEIELLLQTQSVLSLGNGDSLTGSGGVNVVDVTNDVSLSGGGTLTLSGTAADIFYIRIGGTMTLSGGSEIALSGIDASQVIWDFIGTGQDVDFNGDSTARGTFLAIDRSIIVAGGLVEGALISNGDEIKLQSGPDVNFVGFVPEPGTLSLGAASLLSVLLFRRRQRQR